MAAMTYHTVGDWESAHLDDPAKWFLLCRAYIDGSLRLCNAMIAGEHPLTFQHGQVAMGLCFHSVELFYKGVLRKATGKAPKGHNLVELEGAVKSAAPGVAASFSNPFVLEESPTDVDPAMVAEIAEFKGRSARTMDQQFRYHLDQDGNPWPSPQGFNPGLFLATLRYCSMQYDLIIELWAQEDALGR